VFGGDQQRPRDLDRLQCPGRSEHKPQESKIAKRTGASDRWVRDMKIKVGKLVDVIPESLRPGDYIILHREVPCGARRLWCKRARIRR